MSVSGDDSDDTHNFDTFMDSFYSGEELEQQQEKHNVDEETSKRKRNRSNGNTSPSTESPKKRVERDLGNLRLNRPQSPYIGALAKPWPSSSERYSFKQKDLINLRRSRRQNKGAVTKLVKLAIGLANRLIRFWSNPILSTGLLPIDRVAAAEKKRVFDGYTDEELKHRNLLGFEYDERAQLKYVNRNELELIRQQQIQLLGSEEMYKRVNENLKNMKFEAHFAQEQTKLFHWREEFFKMVFPVGDDGPVNWENWEFGEVSPLPCVVCEVFPCLRGCFTVSINITKYWPRVATFACCATPTGAKPFIPHFEPSEDETYTVEKLYKRGHLVDFIYTNPDLTRSDLMSWGLHIKDVFHIIVAEFATGPLKLKHLALKSAMLQKWPPVPEKFPEIQIHTVSFKGHVYWLDIQGKTIQERAEKVFYQIEFKTWNFNLNFRVSSVRLVILRRLSV